MKKPQNNYTTGLKGDEAIEVIAIKDDLVCKLIMTYSQWLNFSKKPKWEYIPYQLNFSQFKIDKTIKI